MTDQATAELREQSSGRSPLHRWPRIAGALIAVALLAAPPVADAVAAPAGDGAAVARLRKSGEDATRKLVELDGRLKRAGAAERSKLLRSLRGAAIERQELLAALIEDHPDEVLRLALPDKVAGRMPAEIQPFLEQPVEIEGELEVLHFDLADGGGEYRYFLRTDFDERFSLHFAEEPRGFASGATVRADGLLLEGVSADGNGDENGAMALASDRTVVQVLAADGATTATKPASGLTRTFGRQTTVVLLVNFKDDPNNEPWTTNAIDAMVNGTLSDFFLENSTQQTWLDADVFGWYTLPINGTSCSYNSIASYAQTAATKAGVDLSAYGRRIFVFPRLSACPWIGLGTIGGAPSKSWINGIEEFGVYAHELGHNFGLYHSHALDCGDKTLCGTGKNVEYGHYGDAMGSGVRGHYNSFQKERLGWLNFGASPPTVTALTSGTYTITPYSGTEGDSKALKVLKSGKTWYYVEARRAIGFDAPLARVPGVNFLAGVTIHRATTSSPNSSYLLDMTPTTDNNNLADAALAVGHGFTDSAAGITITPLAVSDTEATIDVYFGAVACAHANPTVTLSPGESLWASAGDAVTYTVSVTNNDGAGCSSSTFNLASGVPAGWSASAGASSLKLAAGARGTTTLQVISPASSPDGFHDVTATARMAGASAFAGLGAATYVVNAGM